VRLAHFDYASPGAYFVTLVAHGRARMFGEIRGGQMRLSSLGVIADSCWREISVHYPHVQLGSRPQLHSGQPAELG
jgi:hypothetical protein